MSGIIPTFGQIDELHRKCAQSQAAYDLIHTHCQIIAQITRQLIHRQNALFMRRCTLPDDALERTGDYPTLAANACRRHRLAGGRRFVVPHPPTA